MKKIIPIVLLLILLAAGILFLKKQKQRIAGAPRATPITYTVKTVQPETKTITQTRSFLARLESVNSAEISSKLSGRIIDLAVRESQAVHPGDILVHIDEQEILSGIKGLQAQLVAAEKQRTYSTNQYKRNLALFRAGGLAREKLEASEVEQNSAIAAVQDLHQKIKALENQRDYANITAPFAGIVGTIFLRRGDLAVPGRTLLNLNALPQKLTFRFMPESEDIQTGQSVLLQGRQIGTIRTLYDDAQDGLSIAEVSLENRLDRPNNSYLTITVLQKTASGCGVPIQALLHRKTGIRVMAFQDGRFREEPVTVIVQDKKTALIEPCIQLPVAIASEAKLSLLPTYGRIRRAAGETDD